MSAILNIISQMNYRNRKKRLFKSVILTPKDIERVKTRACSFISNVCAVFPVNLTELMAMSGMHSHVFTDRMRNYRLTTLAVLGRTLLQISGRACRVYETLELMEKVLTGQKSLVLRVIEDGEPLREGEFLAIGPSDSRRKKRPGEKDGKQQALPPAAGK